MAKNGNKIALSQIIELKGPSKNVKNKALKPKKLATRLPKTFKNGFCVKSCTTNTTTTQHSVKTSCA